MNEPLVKMTRNDEDLLSLSFVLRDQKGLPIVAMDENAFEAYPENVHDLTVATRKKSVKVWFAKADIGLEISFDRLTIRQLEERLAEDRERSKRESSRVIEELSREWPSEARAMIESTRTKPRMWPPGFGEGLPPELLEACFSDDQVGHGVKRWASTNCMDEEKRIPFLNFEELAIYFHGHKTRIRNGIGGMIYNASFDCAGGVNLKCGCPRCSPARQGETDQ